MPATQYLSAAALSQQTAAALEEELEDLRLAALAFARLKTFKPNEAISHEEMMKKFLN